MGLPLVSVLIPMYENSNAIPKAIESVIQQSYPNIEIIICDDSSDSRVNSMIKPYLEEMPKLKYYKNDRKLYIKNWHKCFEFASGEFINYLKEGDVFHKEKIEKMIYYFNEFENIKLVTSFQQTINEKGELRTHPLLTERLYKETRILNGKDIANYALTHCSNVVGDPGSVLFRKSDLKIPFGIYQGKQFSFLNGLATWLNLLYKGKAVYIPEALSYVQVIENENNNIQGINNAYNEWLDLIIASKKGGFFKTKDQYMRALTAYRSILEGKHKYRNDIKKVDDVLRMLFYFYN